MAADEIGKGKIVIEVDDQGAKKEVRSLDKSVDQLGTTAKKSSAAGSTLTSMLGDWRVQLAAVAVVAKKALDEFAEMYKTGKEFADLREGFALMGGNIDVVRGAVNGLVSDIEAMRLYNLAISLGLTAEQFALIGKYADYADDTLGTGFLPTMQGIIQAMGTGRTASLVAFGLDVDVVGDKSEKAAAAMAEMQRVVDGLPPGFQSASDNTTQLSASFDNLYNSASASVAKMVDLDGVAGPLATSFNWLADRTDWLAEHALGGLAKAIAGTIPGLSSAIALVDSARGVYGVIDDALTKPLKGAVAEFANLEETLAFFGGAQSGALAEVNLDVVDLVGQVKQAHQQIKALTADMTVGEIEFPGLDTALAVAQRERDIAYDNASMLVEIGAWKNEQLVAQQAAASAAIEADQQRHQDTMASMQQTFAGMFAGTWSAMWQEIAAGSGFDTILKMFLDMIGNMAIQLGNMIMLAAIAFQAVPIFGLIGAGGVAAGLALMAFGGVVKGLASSISSGGSSATSAASSSTYGGGYTGNTVTSDTGSRSITINIDASGSLDTSESIAAKVAKALRLADAMGY